MTLLPIALGSAALAENLHFGLELDDSLNVQSNYFDRGENGFSRDRTYNLLTMAPALFFSLEKGIEARIIAKLEWEHELDSEDEAGVETDEVTLSNAYLGLGGQEFTTALGMQPVQFGRGLIMADDALAAAFNWSPGKIYLQLQAAQALDASPMAGVTLGYRPGFLESIELFGAWFEDRDDAFARNLPELFLLTDGTSEGRLYWVGAAADLFVGKVLLKAVGVLEQGEVTFDHPRGHAEREVRGFLADIGLEGNLTDWFSLGAFYFTSSGDEQPRQGDLEAFVSPVPVNPRAAIFFDPAFMDRDEDDSLSYGGTTAAGVMAPGLTFSLQPAAGALVEATVASFYAQETADEDRRWYGWEADLGISFAFKRKYQVYAQAARFEHEDRFQNSQGQTPDPALLFIVGARAAF